MWKFGYAVVSALGRAFTCNMVYLGKFMPASSPAPWPALRVTYHVTASNQPDLDARVESLLLEQTVELPRAALRLLPQKFGHPRNEPRDAKKGTLTQKE